MPTEDQLLDLRRDLGDANNAFSEEELIRLLQRSENASGTQQHYVALAMGIFQLMTQSARFATYTVNEAQERRSEIYEHLKDTYEILMKRPDVNEALGSAAGSSFQARKFSYTRTRNKRTDEYAFPDRIWR